MVDIGLHLIYIMMTFHMIIKKMKLFGEVQQQEMVIELNLQIYIIKNMM
jgi:hypothetical protein